MWWEEETKRDGGGQEEDGQQEKFYIQVEKTFSVLHRKEKMTIYVVLELNEKGILSVKK